MPRGRKSLFAARAGTAVFHVPCTGGLFARTRPLHLLPE